MLAIFVHYSRQGLANLMASKLRTGLAILGILIGTATIVALISCGQLATEKALEQFKLLGTELIAVSISQPEGTHTNNGKRDISLDVWRELPALTPDILRIAPYNTTYLSVSYEGKTFDPAIKSIIGADESLARILGIKLSDGHFVSSMASFERVCVIGSKLAQQLKQITLEDPLGKQLRIGDALYTIIGVAEPWSENGFFNEDINQAVIIPIAGMGMLNKETRVNDVIFLLKPGSHIDPVIEQIKHAISMQAPGLSVFIRSAKQIIAGMESQNQIFNLLLGVIAGVSLLIGGIGVMNIMLVSVSERKKEIGIRKAIGAKNYEIQLLFLVEAIMLSLLGGVVGSMTGLVFTWAIAWFSQWIFTIYVMPIFVGFSVSVASGIFFGFYPAYRAAKLEPMDSLRSG